MIIPILQADIFDPTVAETPLNLDPALIIQNPIFWLVLLVLGVFAMITITLLIVKRAFNRSGSAKRAFDMVVLHIKVPKETSENGDNSSQQQIQERIAVMETIFSTIGSLPVEKGLRAWLFGRGDHATFEIVAHKDKISFYTSVPRAQQHFIEEQIHAQYPHAEIEDVTDYNMFAPTGVVMGSYLKLRRSNGFPIKTYRKLESDPLNSLTNALSKVTGDDGAVIQYVIRSAHKDWRSEGLRIAKEMQQGKKLSQVESRGIASSVGKELKSLASTAKPSEKKSDEPYRLSPLEEEMVKGLEEKASKAGLDVNVRIVVSSSNAQKAQQYLNDILGAYGQYNIYEYGNSFSKTVPRFQSVLIRHFIFRHFDERHRFVLNAEELASLYHLPLASTETPKIDWLLSRRALPPTNLPTEGLLLGHSEYRGHDYLIRMQPQDRRRHMYVIGKSGSGKTELMKSMVKQDIEEGRGVCVIDPHGDFADDALAFVPRERADDELLGVVVDEDEPGGLEDVEELEDAVLGHAGGELGPLPRLEVEGSHEVEPGLAQEGHVEPLALGLEGAPLRIRPDRGEELGVPIHPQRV
jgi:hypothetical protein